MPTSADPEMLWLSARPLFLSHGAVTVMSPTVPSSLLHPLASPSVPRGKTTGQPLNYIFPPVVLLSYYPSSHDPSLLLLTFCFSSSTGLESGGVTLKEPASEGEIESSAPVTLRCHIDGHPR